MWRLLGGQYHSQIFLLSGTEFTASFFPNYRRDTEYGDFSKSKEDFHVEGWQEICWTISLKFSQAIYNSGKESIERNMELGCIFFFSFPNPQESTVGNEGSLRSSYAPAGTVLYLLLPSPFRVKGSPAGRAHKVLFPAQHPLRCLLVMQSLLSWEQLLSL